MDYAPGMEDMSRDSGMSKDKERPITEEGTPEDSGETLHVPREFLQGTTFKEGDELVLKVVAADDDGLEVAYAKAPDKEDASETEGSDANSEIDSINDGY